MLALEIGLAFFVAGFITFTYELLLRGFAEQVVEATHEAHKESIAKLQTDNLKHIKLGVFNATLGHDVDPTIFAEINRVILSSDFVRRSFVITIDSEPLTRPDLIALGIDENKTLIKLNVRISYDVTNKWSYARPYHYEWLPVFDSPIHLGRKYDQFTSFDISGFLGSDEYPGPAKGAAGQIDWKTETADGGMRHRIRLENETFLVSPAASTHIEYTYRMLARIEDLQTWSSPCAVETLTFVIKDHTGRKLTFHPRPDNIISAYKIYTKDGTQVWHASAALLPHQGVTIYWHPVQ